MAAVLTVAQTAIVLGLSKDATYRAIHRGQIPALKLGARLVVPRAKLAELLGADWALALEAE